MFFACWLIFSYCHSLIIYVKEDFEPVAKDKVSNQGSFIELPHKSIFVCLNLTSMVFKCSPSLFLLFDSHIRSRGKR